MNLTFPPPLAPAGWYFLNFFRQPSCPNIARKSFDHSFILCTFRPSSSPVCLLGGTFLEHFQSIRHGKSMIEIQLILWEEWCKNGGRCIARFEWKYQTIWEGIKDVCRRFEANITYNSSIDSIGAINVCLKLSSLQRHVKTLKFTTNMPLQLQIYRSVEIFSHQLLQLHSNRNRKVLVNLTSGRNPLSYYFCNLVALKRRSG